MEHQSPLPLRIRALGALCIESPAGSLHLRAARIRKPLELLQALIAAGANGVGQHHLCEALWRDSEGDAAYRSLITTVYRLRRWLQCCDAVTFIGGRVALSVQHCWIDVWAFEQALNRHGSGIDARELLSLYGGPLLPGCELPLVLDKREQLQRRYLRSVLQALRQLEQSGHRQAAIEVAERAVEAEPASEELHRELIALLGRDGQAAAASIAYRRCRAALLRNFGLRPSPATEHALLDARRLHAASGGLLFNAAHGPLAV